MRPHCADDLAEAEAGAAMLQQGRQDAEEQCAELQQTCQQLAHKCEMLECENAELKSETSKVSALESQVASLEAAHAELQRSKIAAEARCRELEQEHERAELALAAQQQAKEDAAAKISSLESEMAAASPHMIQDLHDQVAAAASQISRLESEKADLQAHIRSLHGALGASYAVFDQFDQINNDTDQQGSTAGEGTCTEGCLDGLDLGPFPLHALSQALESHAKHNAGPGDQGQGSGMGQAAEGIEAGDMADEEADEAAAMREWLAWAGSCALENVQPE